MQKSPRYLAHDTNLLLSFRFPSPSIGQNWNQVSNIVLKSEVKYIENCHDMTDFQSTYTPTYTESHPDIKGISRIQIPFIGYLSPICIFMMWSPRSEFLFLISAQCFCLNILHIGRCENSQPLEIHFPFSFDILQGIFIRKEVSLNSVRLTSKVSMPRSRYPISWPSSCNCIQKSGS